MQIRSFYDLFKEISAHVISFFFCFVFFFPQGHVACRNLILSRQGFIFCPRRPKKVTYKKRRYLYNQAPYCSSFISCYDNLSP